MTDYWLHNSRMTDLEKEIWNAAIEAASEAMENVDSFYWGNVKDAKEELGKLKK